MIDDTVHLQFTKKGFQTDNKYSKLLGKSSDRGRASRASTARALLRKGRLGNVLCQEANQWRAPSRRTTGCPSGVTD